MDKDSLVIFVFTIGSFMFKDLDFDEEQVLRFIIEQSREKENFTSRIERIIRGYVKVNFPVETTMRQSVIISRFNRIARQVYNVFEEFGIYQNGKHDMCFHKTFNNDSFTVMSERAMVAHIKKELGNEI